MGDFCLTHGMLHPCLYDGCVEIKLAELMAANMSLAAERDAMRNDLGDCQRINMEMVGELKEMRATLQAVHKLSDGFDPWDDSAAHFQDNLDALIGRIPFMSGRGPAERGYD